MTEEEATHLRQEHAALKEALAQKDRRIEELEGLLMSALLRIEELERRLGKQSQNSSKPPSSDGFARQGKQARPKSENPSGGQVGHQGHTLQQVTTPDHVIRHRPDCCEACQCDLQDEVGQIKERRQIHELSDLRLQVTEHQVEAICCPRCRHQTFARFPAGVDAPAQYGPRVQALAIYLSQFQLLPLSRISELFADLDLGQISQGSLTNWIAEAARILDPPTQTLKELLLESRLHHVDETGIRIKGLLHWGHVHATKWLTFYSWDRKRGQDAMDEFGILPRSTGRAMHDRLSSYDHYSCQQSVCGAHLLRDCLWVAEREKQPWATAMYEVLAGMAKAAKQWRVQGAKAVPHTEREEWIARYFSVLADRFAAHLALAPPEGDRLPKKAGRRKQSDSKNLLDALLKRAEQVLAFLDDLSIPFTNNQAERDLRVFKVQQKISGTFRSEAGTTAVCTIRSYLSTMRKQGRSMLEALTAVFHGSPFPIAWEPGI